MSGIDIAGIVTLIILAGIFFGLYKIIKGFINENDFFNYERDHKQARTKYSYKDKNRNLNIEEGTYIGISTNKQNVFIPSNAKHVFICGTTGSGKTVALANFIKAGTEYDYPMLIVDGKGDTDTDSLLNIVKEMRPDKKTYIINFNEPEKSDKYNPFKNTNTDVIKDMLINMTHWSEEHYKYNTERYIQRLLKLLEMAEIELSLESLITYLPVDNFNKLSRDMSLKELISKEERIEDSELSKTSGKIAEGASARFATIKESRLGQIFEASGIDIYTALEENAAILFILNPLLYPEMSPLIGNLIVIDSKKGVSKLFENKKKRIFYILDEINTYASEALLDLVNKSRSANITCILATQSLSDLDSVSEHFKEQIIENCNNYIVLRQNSSVNAEHWASVFGTRETMQATYQIKEGESTLLGSLRKTREFIYHPDDIKLLKTGSAIFLSRDRMEHTKLSITKPF